MGDGKGGGGRAAQARFASVWGRLGAGLGCSDAAPWRTHGPGLRTVAATVR